MTDLSIYGYCQTEEENDNTVPARITAVHRERYELICEKGPVYAQLKTAVYYGQGTGGFSDGGGFCAHPV